MSDDAADDFLDSYASPDPNILFDDDQIKSLDFSKTSCYTKHGLSYQNPGARNGVKLIARPLERTDYDKNYLALLSQLTKVGNYSSEVFQKQFDRMKKMPGVHYIVVVEDSGSINGMKGKIVASATLLVECKFVHNAAMRGRIEDVVVDSDYRGMHLGSLLLETLCLLSQALGCYKLTLDCKKVMCPFYFRLDYKDEGQFFLTQRFYD